MRKAESKMSELLALTVGAISEDVSRFRPSAAQVQVYRVGDPWGPRVDKTKADTESTLMGANPILLAALTPGYRAAAVSARFRSRD